MLNSIKELNQTVRSFAASYWLLNLIQMTERMAYWIVVLQLPIYIAQKDIEGGLQWDQADKGIIYFWWALTQHLIPIFAGGFADKYGRKKVLVLSFVISVLGFIILGTQRQFLPFLFGAVTLGIGLGLFKPALQGAIAFNLNDKNANAGWSINILLINLSVFFGSYFSRYFREISWESVFYYSAAIMALNFIFVIFIKKQIIPIKNNNEIALIRKIFINLIKPKVLLFILLMSGFTMIYMQFYETLPNFIFDWVDTNIIVTDFNLPDFLTVETSTGVMISYEAMYSLNSFLIIFLIVPISWIFADRKLTLTILFGIILSTIGLTLSGLSTYGYFAIAGIMIYTFGEMITNPRFSEYMSKIAPVEDKSLFMGFMSISWAIGLAGGGILGGNLYKVMAEKSGFAIRYLNEKFPDVDNINNNNAFNILADQLNISKLEVNQLLWNEYSPWQLWIPFALIAVMSVIGLFLYSKYHEK